MAASFLTMTTSGVLGARYSGGSVDRVVVNLGVGELFLTMDDAELLRRLLGSAIADGRDERRGAIALFPASAPAAG